MGMTAASHHHNRVQGPSQIRRPGQKDSHRFQPRCHCPSLQVTLTSGRTGWGSATGWPPAPSTTSWWTRPTTWGSTCDGPMSSELSSGAWLWGKYKCHPNWKCHINLDLSPFTDLSTWFLLGVVWTFSLWGKVSRRSSPPPLSLRPTETDCLGGFLGESLRISGKILWPSFHGLFNQNDICFEKISLLILMYWPLTTNDDHHVAYCGLLMQMLLFSILFLSF